MRCRSCHATLPAGARCCPGCGGGDPARPPGGAGRQARRQRPAGSPVMIQAWRDLLFAHWRVPAETLAPLLPRGLQVQTFDGSAWVGIVPFELVAYDDRLFELDGLERPGRGPDHVVTSAGVDVEVFGLG